MSTLLDWLIDHEPSFRHTRLPSLYSDLSVQKTSNPEGYAANVTAWSAALTRAALAGQLPPEQNLLLLQTSDELLNALASATYGRPSGLGCVLDECVGQGKFIDSKDFVGAERSIYSGCVLGSGSYEISGGRLKQGKLVLVPALEEVWKRLQPVVEGRGQGVTDRVMNRDVFAREVSELLVQGESEGTKTGAFLSEQDLQVLLRYLSRDKQALSYNNSTVKFKPPTASIPEPITQEDGSIASLKSLLSNLQQQTTALSTRITTLQSTASSAVKIGNKPSALSALRSKKLAERTLQQRLDTLSQLEEIYTKIESAVSQVEILAVMESSAATLKTLNKKIGGVERVEDVLDSLREEVGKVDEVSGVLAEPVDQKTLLDEADVDDELEAMEREERERAQKSDEEATRKRLQEIDALEHIRKETERAKQREKEQEEKEKELEGQNFTREKDRDTNEQLEDALSTSIEKMRMLDIEDLRREKEAADLQRERARLGQERQKEPVVEGAL